MVHGYLTNPPGPGTPPEVAGIFYRRPFFFGKPMGFHKPSSEIDQMKIPSNPRMFRPYQPNHF